MATQGIQRFLLVQHKEVNIIAPQPAKGAFQRSLRRFPIVAVGLGADHIVRRILQRQADVRVIGIQIRCIQKAYAAFIGINQQMRPLLGCHILLQRRERERAEAQLTYPQSG